MRMSQKRERPSSFTKRLVTATLGIAGIWVTTFGVQVTRSEEIPQAATVAPPPTYDTHRLYVMAEDFIRGLANPVVIVVDGEKMRLITQFTVGYLPTLTLSAERSRP